MEALFAAFLTVTVLTVTLSLYLTGMMAWTKGEANILSETGSHVAIRVIANELRQAMSVVVDPNGDGVTYTLPLQANGTDVLPLVADGQSHRIELDGTNLNMVENGVVMRTICTGVILTDPLSANGAQAYQIFTPGAGTLVRSITVEVANTASAYQTANSGISAQTQTQLQTLSARNRETVYLRNVPQTNF